MSFDFDRRTALAGLAAFAAGTVLPGIAAAPAKPRTMVLVHGAWHGSWAWDAVKPLLEQQGVRVFAPTLRGLAERQGENGPDVTLKTHVEEVVKLLDEQDLTDVVLVGHSYAGFVVTGVCDRRPERVAHVVYLDAFVPESGQRFYDFIKPANLVAAMRAATQGPGRGYQAFAPNAAMWGLSGPLLEMVNRRMTPHPAMTLEEPLVLTRNGPYAVPRRTYVDCTQPAMPPFVETKARLAGDARWNYITVPAGHEVMLTHPQWVVDILARLA
jgi:pimeloyl-ACP methyl ester carboxylesterase